jgi:NADH dehydrogenase (ubiquinone) 1 alpha subcomplex subunit 9
LFHLNNGKTRTRPAHVLDVAEALAVICGAPKTSIGATFALPGPRTYTYSNLIKLVEAFTLKSHAAPILPKPIATLIASVLNRALWWPTVSPDEVIRKYIDDASASPRVAAQDVPAGWEEPVATGLEAMRGVNGEAVKSWADLNIEPETIEEHAIKYLRRYRTA